MEKHRFMCISCDYFISVNPAEDVFKVALNHFDSKRGRCYEGLVILSGSNLYKVILSDLYGRKLTVFEYTIAVREPLQRFTFAMEEKLRRNDYKKHWREASIGELFAGLLGEIEELKEELFGGGDKSEAKEEAVDVANFAMMIWDWVSEKE